jgi:hypothetical protein
LAGNVQAEEGSQKEQPPAKPSFFQPGAGYKKEPEYKFTGVIRKLPEGGMAGTWVVDDRLIVVTPMTEINEDNSKIALGVEVEVNGLLRGMDFIALHIKVTSGGKKAP